MTMLGAPPLPARAQTGPRASACACPLACRCCCARAPALLPVRARYTASRRRRLPLSNNFVITFTSVHTFEFGRKNSVLHAIDGLCSGATPRALCAAPARTPVLPSIFPSPLCVSSDEDTRPRALRACSCPSSSRAAPLHTRTSLSQHTSAPGQACQLGRESCRGRGLARLYPQLPPHLTRFFALTPPHTTSCACRALCRDACAAVIRGC